MQRAMETNALDHNQLVFELSKKINVIALFSYTQPQTWDSEIKW